MPELRHEEAHPQDGDEISERRKPVRGADRPQNGRLGANSALSDTPVPAREHQSALSRRSPARTAASLRERPVAASPAKRAALRTAIYFLYDGVAGERKEPFRVAKVVLETVLDECMPPPHRADMSLWQKFSEYLAPCALSALLWSAIAQVRLLQRRALIGRGGGASNRYFVLRAAWTTVHRTARQALINRLFFRMGSAEYSLASALGIVCCFFREDLFFEIHKLRRWPKHFSLPQGMGALFRSLIYAGAFSLPLQNVSQCFAESRRRRGNAKKLIFATVLTQVKHLHQLYMYLAAASPRFSGV